MKFKADRKDLLAAIGRVVGAVEKRSTIPVLSHVLLEAARGTLRISASDLNTHVTTSVGIGIQGEPGHLCVPADKLKAALEKIGADIVQVGLEEGRLVVSGDDRKVALSTLPAEQFPAPKESSAHEVGVFPGGYLRRVLAAVSHAASTNEGKYSLCGVSFLVEGHNLTAAATDGRRLSIAAVDGSEYDLPAPFILPTRAAKLAAAIDCNQNLYFEGEGIARFCSSREHETDIRANTIDAEVLDFRRAVPRHELAVLVDSEKLTEAIELCGIVADDGARSVTLEIREEEIEVSALGETGVSQATLPVQHDTGQTARIRINSKYLLQALHALDSEEIFIKFKCGSSPLLLVPVDNDYWDERLEVLMPLRG